MVGNLVAKMATWCRAEPGDLYAATRITSGRLTPELRVLPKRILIYHPACKSVIQLTPAVL